MFKGFDTIKAQLAELAPAINAFKSEAVQLRIVELIFAGREGADDDPIDPPGGEGKRKAQRQRRPTRRKGSAGDAAQSGKKKGEATGPVLTLNELIDGGFFTKHRTLTEIIEHCRNSKAKNFRPRPAIRSSGPIGSG